jgi:hypothetical protein
VASIIRDQLYKHDPTAKAKLSRLNKWTSEKSEQLGIDPRKLIRATQEAAHGEDGGSDARVIHRVVSEMGGNGGSGEYNAVDAANDFADLATPQE